MDVLIVIGQLTLGGAEKHLSYVVPELLEKKIQVAIFCLRGGGELQGQLESQGVEVISPSSYHRGITGLCFSAAEFLRVLYSRRPKIIHYFLPEAYLLGGLCQRFAPASVEIMSRRSLNNYQKRRTYAKSIEKYLHKKLSFALANSTAVKMDLVDEGIPEEKISIIYNGVQTVRKSYETEEKTELKRGLDIKESDIVLIIVANLIPYKGHADLLQALHAVSNSGYLNWKLLVIGRDSAGIANELKAYAAELNLAHNIIWLGHQADPSPYLAAANIAISASHEEGFSNAILEYMHHGLPIIASAVGGNKDALENNESGLLFPARDKLALTNAILSLITSAEMRTRLGERAKVRVETKFTLDACVESYAEIYRKALS